MTLLDEAERVRENAPMRRAAGIALFIALALAVVARTADAERTRASARLVFIREEGTEACPSEQALRDAVAARLGYDPFHPDAADTLTFTLSREKNSFRGKLAYVRAGQDNAALRTLESASCEDLVTTASLTASVALDPLHGTGPPPPLAASSSPPPPASASASASEDTSQGPPPPKERRLAVLVGLSGYTVLGSAPSATFGGGLHADVRVRPLRFGIEGRAELPAEADSNVKGRVRSSSIGVLALACGELGRDPLGAFLCASGGATSLEASSIGVASPREESAVVPVLGGRIGVFRALGDFELRLYSELLARLRPVRLEQDGREAFAYSTWFGAIGIAAGVKLW